MSRKAPTPGRKPANPDQFTRKATPKRKAPKALPPPAPAPLPTADDLLIFEEHRTQQQQRFVLEYLKDFNGTQAAIRAGYSPRSAYSTASDLLRLPDIARLVREASARQLEALEIDVTFVRQQLKYIAAQDDADILDEHGDVLPIHEIPRPFRAAIAGVEWVMKNATAGDGKIDRVGKVKRWSKTEALKILAQHLGMLQETVKVGLDDALIARLRRARLRIAEAKKQHGE